MAKTDSLEKLFDQFNTDEFYGKAEHTFVPHFTIAQGLSSQEFEDIYGQVKLAGVDHKETISELSLLQYSEEDDKWSVIETFKLDNKNIWKWGRHFIWQIIFVVPHPTCIIYRIS